MGSFSNPHHYFTIAVAASVGDAIAGSPKALKIELLAIFAVVLSVVKLRRYHEKQISAVWAGNAIFAPVLISDKMRGDTYTGYRECQYDPWVYCTNNIP